MKPPGRRRLLALRLLLAGAALAAFAAALLHGFAMFDDPGFITGNRHVRAGLSLEGLRWAFTSLERCNWHPLTWISYQFVAGLGGAQALGFHAASLLLHAAAAQLLFTALLRMTGALWPSALAAGLFALHPQRVESVAWAAELKDPLSAVFLLLAVLAHLRAASRPGRARQALVALLLALGLMVKPSLVVLPALLLVLDFWPLGRMRAPAALPRLIAEKAPLAALSTAAAVVAWKAQAGCGALIAVRLTLPERAANAVVSTATTLGQMLLPSGLAFFYPRPDAQPLAALLGAGAALAAVSALAVWQIRRRPSIAAGWLWFLAAFAPVSGIAQVGEQLTADRFTYLPAMGAAMALAWGGRSLVRHPRARVAAIAGAAGALLLLGGLAWRQTRLWRDDETLLRHAAAVTRGNWMAHTLLGIALGERGRTEEGIAQLEEAVRIKPGFAEAAGGLGHLRSRQGRHEEALQWNRRAVELGPDMALTHYNLAVTLDALGRHEEALGEYEAALRLDPWLAQAYNNIGAIHYLAGRRAEAAAMFREALRADPGYTQARENLARVGGR